MSYIRPTLKIRPSVPQRFTTVTNSNGAHVSAWVDDAELRAIPTGTYGRVGDVCAKINLGAGSVSQNFKAPWSPPLDYKSYAIKKNMGPEFLKKCEDWYKDHPHVAYVPAKLPDIDPVPVTKMMKKYSRKGPEFEGSSFAQPTRPPLDRMMVAWECAGYTPESIELARARLEFAESQMDVRQQALDTIFARYPSASKPASKKKKVIKAVKKKMT
jgi:hypothetical protein